MLGDGPHLFPGGFLAAFEVGDQVGVWVERRRFGPLGLPLGVLRLLVAIDEHPALERLVARGLVRMPTRPASRLDVSDAVQARGTVSDLVSQQRR